MRKKLLSVILTLSLVLGLGVNAAADYSYVIKPGDTLWDIAKQYYDNGQKYSDIFDANKDSLKSADEIYPGQEIVIPDIESGKVTDESETEGSVDVAEDTETNDSESVDISDNSDNQRANGSPWINSNLKENVTADMAVNAKDDLYLYANKDWILNHVIPDGRVNWSEYSQVSTENVLRCIKLLESGKLKGKDGEQIMALYDACLNWESRNAKGVSELKEYTDLIQNIDSVDALNSLLTDKEYAYIADEFLDTSVDCGFTNPDDYVAFISCNMSLVRSDSAEYEKLTDYGKLLESYRKEMFFYILKKLGYTEEESHKKFENVLKLDGILAPFIYTQEESMSSDFYELVNNEMSLKELKESVNNFPIEEFLAAYGLIYKGDYVVENPEYLLEFDGIYTDDNLELLKDKLIYDACIDNRGYLDKDIFDKNKEIYNRTFGVSGVKPEKEEALEAVLSFLPNQMARSYIDEYSSKEDRDRIKQVCIDVIASFKEIVTDNTWLSEDSKKACLNKLDKMGINVGWPDKWDDYSGLNLSGKSYFEMLGEISAAKTEVNHSKLGKKADRDNWAGDYNILTCNAWYSFSENSFSILIGMMGDPFYYSDMTTEELYASIGAFWVGHEVSHAFDSAGANFDENGALVSWWSKADEEEFARRVGKVDDYLDGIRIMENYYVNGSNVDSEMIADFTGLQCAINMAKKLPSFDYKEFFEYYAKMNVDISLYSDLLSQLQSDPHPLDYLRGNVPVQQFEEFYEAFDIGPEDNMYLAPEDRFTIW